MNSESYIDLILQYYADNNIPVEVFVDGKTKDSTAATAQKYAPVKIITNTSSTIDGVIGDISRAASTEWVLRFDDDELPSNALMQFVTSAINCDNADVYGFWRFQCAVSKDGDLLFSKEHSPKLHMQHRLYRPSKVKFISEIHTPGFSLYNIARGRHLTAPAMACCIHLDWAVHSYADRLEKVQGYEAHTLGSTSNWRAFYLYEDYINQKQHSFAKFELQEFKKIASQIMTRLPSNCVDFVDEKSSDVDVGP